MEGLWSAGYCFWAKDDQSHVSYYCLFHNIIAVGESEVLAVVPASGVIPRHPTPAQQGWGASLSKLAPFGIARSGQACFPVSTITSARRTTPTSHVAELELSTLLDGSSAGELIPVLASYCLQDLINLEATAVIGADRHERSEGRANYRHGSWSRTLTNQVSDLDLLISKLRQKDSWPRSLSHAGGPARLSTI